MAVEGVNSHAPISSVASGVEYLDGGAVAGAVNPRVVCGQCEAFAVLAEFVYRSYAPAREQEHSAQQRQGDLHKAGILHLGYSAEEALIWSGMCLMR